MNVVICLFFTLSWRIADRANLPHARAGGGGDTATFPRSQLQSSPERGRIGSPSPRQAPEAQHTLHGLAPGATLPGELSNAGEGWEGGSEGAGLCFS